MATLRVYQYDYFDRQLMRPRRSEDFATSDAIQEMGATALSETVRFVEEDVIDDNGHVKWADLMPRVPDESRTPHRLRPGTPRR